MIWERVGCELMKRMYLLRHAKSSWKDASLPDRERPLSGRGRRAAKAMSRHLDEASVQVQLVLCSPATRTRETLELIRPCLTGSRVQIEAELYRATAAELLERVRHLPDAVDSVLIIGHNPALHQLTLDLARPGSLTSRLAEKYPTGALVELELGVDSWTLVGEGAGEVVSFVRPRDL
jgi:phosphohistidine phosphatase